MTGKNISKSDIQTELVLSAPLSELGTSDAKLEYLQKHIFDWINERDDSLPLLGKHISYHLIEDLANSFNLPEALKFLSQNEDISSADKRNIQQLVELYNSVS